MNKILKTRKDFFKKWKFEKSREFYLGLISLIILFVSIYFLIIVCVSFENKKYSGSDNVFFSGIIIEPTVLNDYQENNGNQVIKSISKDRQNFIDLYQINSPRSRYDSILNYFKSFRYNHGNIEDEIISIESNYIISDRGIVYEACFRLNEFINEKNYSDFKRNIKLVFRTPQNKLGHLYTVLNKDNQELRELIHAKNLDFVSAFQLFEIEDKELIPESKDANDVYKVYDLVIEEFPYKIEFVLNDIPHNSYFDNYEIELISMMDSKGKQNFTVRNNVFYDGGIEVLNMHPVENITTENRISNSIVLQNIPFKNIYVNNQKLPEDIWNEVDRFTFPVDQSISDIYMQYSNVKKELQIELFSIIISILIGAALSIFLNICLKK